MAVARAGYPVWLWLAGPTFSSRIITGAYYIAINVPFVTSLIIKDLSKNFAQFFRIPGAFSQKFSRKT
jgi:hypothetical protein